MMKKLLAMLIALTMVAGLAACATTPAAPEATEAPATEEQVLLQLPTRELLKLGLISNKGMLLARLAWDGIELDLVTVHLQAAGAGAAERGVAIGGQSASNS